MRVAAALILLMFTILSTSVANSGPAPSATAETQGEGY